MNDESTPGPVQPPSDPTPKASLMKFDAKTIAIGLLSVLSALGATGVIPPIVAPAAPASAQTQCADPAFQADVRAALAKLADQQADMRERMARVESALGAGTVR